MSPEALALGLLSAVRVTPLAVVSVLLASPRPRVLLAAFVVAGLAVSVVLGVAAVLLFGGPAEAEEASVGRNALDVALGLGALTYAVALGTGRVANPVAGGGERDPFGPETLLGRQLRNPTVPVAALAGAVTNLPGLYYLAGLVAILDAATSLANGVFQVAVYNVLRFVAPVGALVLVVARPERTRQLVEAIRDWLLRHSLRLIVGVLTVIGLYLIGRGVAGLLG